MKKILAVAAILAVTSANAEELKFGDLNYFLKQGQFNVAADFIVHNETARVAKTVDSDIDAYLINTNFTYALTDRFNFFIGLDYTFDGETSVNNVNNTKKTVNQTTEGLQNPRFGANFRALNQGSADFNLDFGLAAAVKVMDRKIGSGRSFGNAFNPAISNIDETRTNVEFNARLGKKWNEANEFYLLAGVGYNLAGDAEVAGAEDLELEDSVDFRAGAFYQYRPVHEFMMTLGLIGTRYGEVEAEQGTTDATFSDHLDFTFLFNAKYLITESFIGKFTFTQDKRENFEQGDTKIDQRTGLQYGLGVDFLF